MNVLNKLPYLAMIGIIMLALIYLFIGTVTLYDGITSFFACAFILGCTAWMKNDPTIELMAPMLAIAKYIVFATMAITLAIIAFVLKLCPITLKIGRAHV